jgi:hypothetical protein
MYLSVFRCIYSAYQFIFKFFLNYQNVLILCFNVFPISLGLPNFYIIYRSITYKFSRFLSIQYVIFDILHFTHSLGTLLDHFLYFYQQNKFCILHIWKYVWNSYLILWYLIPCKTSPSRIVILRIVKSG